MANLATMTPEELDQRGRRLAAALRAARRIFPNGPAMDRAQAQLIIDDEFKIWREVGEEGDPHRLTSNQSASSLIATRPASHAGGH